MTQDEIRAIALEVANKVQFNTAKPFTCDQIEEFATRLLAAIAEKAEPVAWVSQKSFVKILGEYPPFSVYFRNTRYNEMTIPLYTHPAIAEKAEPVAWINNDPPWVRFTDREYIAKEWIREGHGSVKALFTNPAIEPAPQQQNEQSASEVVTRSSHCEGATTCKSAVGAAPLPDEVREMVERLHSQDDRSQLPPLSRKFTLWAAAADMIERLARQVPPDCVVVPKSGMDWIKKHYPTILQKAGIAAGEVKP